MIIRRVAALAAAAGLVVVACSSSATPAPSVAPSESAAAARRLRRRRLLEQLPGAALGEVGRARHQGRPQGRWGKYISNDAKSSAETQATNVENLISQGANVVVILAQDGTAIKPAVASAISNGIPVIAYDRLIEDPASLYITFDNKLVGKMQAEALLKVKDPATSSSSRGTRPTRTQTSFARGWSRPACPRSARAATSSRTSARVHGQLGSQERPDLDGAVPDGERQQDRHRLRPERRHGRSASSRRSPPRASRARSRSPARTATRPT